MRRLAGRPGRRAGGAGADWNRITRDLLFQIYYPGVADYDELLQDPKTPDAGKIALLSLDPWNITLEPEYYADVRRRALRSRSSRCSGSGTRFDRSPLGGQNVRPRRPAPPAARAAHLRARAARTSKRSSTWSSRSATTSRSGDNVVVHRYVLLDDRGGIRWGTRSRISDYANIYSHTHSIVDQNDVTNALTVLEDDVRITYHATVLAGVRVASKGWWARVRSRRRTCARITCTSAFPAKSIRVKPTRRLKPT